MTETPESFTLSEEETLAGPEIPLSMATASFLRKLLIHQYEHRKGAIHYREWPNAMAAIDVIEKAMLSYHQKLRASDSENRKRFTMPLCPIVDQLAADAERKEDEE